MKMRLKNTPSAQFSAFSFSFAKLRKSINCTSGAFFNLMSFSLGKFWKVSISFSFAKLREISISFSFAKLRETGNFACFGTLRSLVVFVLFGCFFLTSGCQSSKIETYTTYFAEEKPVVMGGLGMAPAQAPLPFDHGTQLAVSEFAGDVGGALANINRWRGQLELSEIHESDVAAAMSVRQISGHRYSFVALTNEKINKGMIVAFVLENGKTKFYKLTGSPKDLTLAKPAFLRHLETLK